MRLFLSVLAILFLGACTPGSTSNSSVSSSPKVFTVSGSLGSAPCYPVEQVGQPPCVRPLPNTALTFTNIKKQAWPTTTDGQGNFTIQLPVGQYRVSSEGAFPSPQVGEADVVNQNIILHLVVDSGIR